MAVAKSIVPLCVISMLCAIGITATLLPSGAQAQSPAVTPTTTALPVQDAVVLVPPGEPPVPLLWKVSDADNAVYLLGSFHLLKPDDYPLSQDVNTAFADADKLMFELPPDEMSSPQLGLKMAQAALRIDGTTLNSQLSPATSAKLTAWTAANPDSLQKAGLEAASLQRFKPWYVGLLISVMDMARHGLEPSLGLDEHFIAAAGAAHKPAGGFETGDQQIAFLDGMNSGEQLQFLDESLSDAAEGDQEIDQLHAAWRAGDGAALFDDMGADMRTRYPLLYQRINVERNEAWLPRIEQMLSSPGTEDTLVVVGSLHLLGSDGLVEKLRAKGYTVERICSSCITPEQGSLLLESRRSGRAVWPFNRCAEPRRLVGCPRMFGAGSCGRRTAWGRALRRRSGSLAVGPDATCTRSPCTCVSRWSRANMLIRSTCSMSAAFTSSLTR